MIRKQDVLDRAAEWGLRPEVVEKDYVLGWLLAGLASTPAKDEWIFKGGTCIKKCVFETYRFSEDLDFSLLPSADYSKASIERILVQVCEVAARLSGIDLPVDRIRVEERRNQQRDVTFKARIYYRGPLAYPADRRVLVDITQHETVLDASVDAAISHPYPDVIPESTAISTYSFEELLAEKTRALYERARPRDLYDVVYLMENRPSELDMGQTRQLFIRKCQVKGVRPPSSPELLALITQSDELRAEWSNMLAHQLPALPDLDIFLHRAREALAWIDEAAPLPVRRELEPVPAGAGGSPIGSGPIRYWGTGSAVEVVRYAGANRLMIEFHYHGKHRIAEPYSLRRPHTGNVLLYAWEEAADQIKAFKIDDIRDVRVTKRSFSPRYRVELSPGAPLPGPDTKDTAIGTGGFDETPPTGLKDGPFYVFECPYCGKQFRRRKDNPRLRQHKMKGSPMDCPGREGHLVEVR